MILYTYYENDNVVLSNAPLHVLARPVHRVCVDNVVTQGARGGLPRLRQPMAGQQRFVVRPPHAPHPKGAGRQQQVARGGAADYGCGCAFLVKRGIY